jgi:hypothetical protein
VRQITWKKRQSRKHVPFTSTRISRVRSLLQAFPTSSNALTGLRLFPNLLPPEFQVMFIDRLLPSRLIKSTPQNHPPRLQHAIFPIADRWLRAYFVFHLPSIIQGVYLHPSKPTCKPQIPQHSPVPPKETPLAHPRLPIRLDHALLPSQLTNALPIRYLRTRHNTLPQRIHTRIRRRATLQPQRLHASPPRRV